MQLDSEVLITSRVCGMVMFSATSLCVSVCSCCDFNCFYVSYELFIAICKFIFAKSCVLSHCHRTNKIKNSTEKARSEWKLDVSRREAVDGYVPACAHRLLLLNLPGKWKLSRNSVWGKGVFVLFPAYARKFLGRSYPKRALLGEGGSGVVWGLLALCMHKILKSVASAVSGIRGVLKFKSM